MIRRIFLSFALLSSALVLLASCAQPMVDRAPQVPTLSTDLGDAATHVATDAWGNAYVLGYRNRPGSVYPETPRSSGLYLSRFDKTGELTWFTDLNQGESTATDRTPETYGVEATETGIYALTQQDTDAGRSPLYLHKLTPEGALLWTGPILEAGAGHEVDIITFQKAPTGQLYVSWVDSWNDGQKAYLGSLDAGGTLRWSLVLRSEEYGQGVTDVSALQQSTGEVRGIFKVAPSADGVYVTNTAQVRKYSAEGNLTWSKALVFEEYTHIGADLAVNGNYIYLVRNLTLKQDVFSYNSEIKRFSTDGDELWTRTVVAPEVASTATAYSSETFGVSAGGKLYLLVASAQDSEGYSSGGRLNEQFLLQFSPDGQRSQRVRLSQEETILDMALVKLENPEHAHVTPSPKFLDYFYAVGRGGLEFDCHNEFEEGDGAGCKDTDAFARLYAGPDSDASTADIALRPQWVRE